MFSETKTCPRHGKISYMLWYTKARVLLWEIISSLGNKAAIPPKTTMKYPVLQVAVPLPAVGSCCSCTQSHRRPCTCELALVHAGSLSQPPSVQWLGHVHSLGIGLGGDCHPLQSSRCWWHQDLSDSFHFQQSNISSQQHEARKELMCPWGPCTSPQKTLYTTSGASRHDSKNK